ncbi:MAG TPA: ArsA family ATPase [Acidimicrobiales bacterium]|jgi:arsenite-transporting ATPase|nr:ArsA family ATPase [Acidimicrobiales bacterium]
MRVLLFTGKGGVGKTTTAAATALRCADAGLRTLVMSTDPAHSLADAFGEALGPLPTAVTDHLWGQELDAQERMEESWGEIQDYLMEIFNWAGLDAIEAEELAVFPGLDEVFSLSDIKLHASSGEWDVLVVDCAPTAETIRFLSLPDILAWYMERLFPVSRRVNKAVSPVLKRVTSLPVAGDSVFAAGRRFYDRLDGVRELLTDPTVTSVRLVVNPERMVIAEARRTYTYLSLFGYRVDAVVANRLLPDDITDPWFAKWRALHAEHLATIEASFAPLPVLKAALADDELVGPDRLRGFAASLYGEHDPASVLHEGEVLKVARRAGAYHLTLELPFADHDDLDVGRKDDELLVRVGPYRRALLLPDSLRRRAITDATLRQGKLRVVFAGDDPKVPPSGRRRTGTKRGTKG